MNRCGSSNLSEQKKYLFRIHFGFDKRSSVVVQICPKCLCIYGFVNKFWTGRIFERLLKVCGGSNLSTDLLLWGIYIKKCISPVRICLQTRNTRNASTKFWKTLESKKAEKSLEISAFLVFSCLHLNQTRIMAGVAGFEPARCKSQSLVPYRLATPQYRSPQCSTKLIICQCFFEDFYSGYFSRWKVNVCQWCETKFWKK